MTFLVSFSSSSMDELYPLFFENLSDSIPSVRQGAAMSLGNVAKAYGMYIVSKTLLVISSITYKKFKVKRRSLDKGTALFSTFSIHLP